MPAARTLVDRAPEAEAWADRMMEKLRPTLTALYGIHRRIATVAVVGLTVWLFIHVMFGANGMVVYKQKKAEYQALQKKLIQVQQDNDRYTQQIQGLKTDQTAIEKEAREQLGYAKPGEYVYVPPKPAPAPQNHSAKK